MRLMPPAHNIKEKAERDKKRREEQLNAYSTAKLKHLWIKKATGLGITNLC